MIQETPLRYLKGVGPNREAAFKERGVCTIKDLLHYFPYRYQDRRNFKKIKDLKIEEFCVVKGTVRTRHLKKFPPFMRRKIRIKSVFEVILEDDSGSLRCSWFNQAYLFDAIKPESSLIIYGKPRQTSSGLQIIPQEYEVIEDGQPLGLDKIVGVYSLPHSFSQKFMRKTMHLVLKNHLRNYPENLPFYIRKEKDIPNIAQSLEHMHFPNSWDEAKQARERFIFEELFFSQVMVYLRKAKHRLQEGPRFKVKKQSIERIKKNLGFELTFSQDKVLSEVLDDFSKTFPMHRLLQGDVGCGKTAVAAFAIGPCVDSGWQAAFMVPTEVLAYQHKDTLDKTFKGLKAFPKGSIKVITSSLSRSKIDIIYEELKEGKIKLIVGTHALLQEGVKFKKLGLVIIDEQHRFGVAQRALLPKKGKIAPHCLVMSATPIPRSLALTLYGDLDISVIKQMPRGRLSPKTLWVKEPKRKWVYGFLKDILAGGRQIYIVYPAIEESQIEELKSLKVMYGKIKKEFSQYSIGMFHGRMKNNEKIKAINDFKEKKTDILVATTVVEVGVNIENATAMLIENPERFGLAQLHQLRGRIQRSNYQPHFILISKSSLSDNSQKRLKIISSESCGFKISEEDLKLRGPGDFFGSLQHGLPDLLIANPLEDLEILKEARTYAYQVIKGDPFLGKPQHRCLRENISSDFFLDTSHSVKQEAKL